MPTCGTRHKSETSEPEYYSLKMLASSAPPQNFNELEDWLTGKGRQQVWDGKMYVASTICWNSNTREFLQTGCSPNYISGWWSLACCKHDMRTARLFRAKAIDLSVPTYVFTLASVHTEIGQPLVSVAQVTENSFETMQEYAQFLLGQRDHKLVSSRLTRVDRRRNQLGWRFGDCHADLSGNVGEPNQNHVHHADNSWKTDINGNI